jgi:dephospho-CoA kinase
LGVGGPAVEPLATAFGEDIIVDGAVRRPALAAKVFDDPGALDKLNEIVHPLISQRVLLRCEALAQKGYRLIVLDAALLCENGRQEPFLDGLIVVDSEVEERIERLMESRGWSREEAEKRVKSQTPTKVKRPLADWVIENNGTLEAFRMKAAELAKDFSEQNCVPIS